MGERAAAFQKPRVLYGHQVVQYLIAHHVYKLGISIDHENVVVIFQDALGFAQPSVA